MAEKEKAKKGGIFNDAKSYVAATSGVLPLASDSSDVNAKHHRNTDNSNSDSGTLYSESSSDPLPSLSATAGCRLWIGNIEPKITEFHLVKLFKQFGTITQMDFLFHKSGPFQGQPRGYAFLSFEKPENAERARQALDGKWAVGKKLAVKYASATRDPSKNKNQMEDLDLIGGGESSSGGKILSDAARQSQIKAIEAKLSTMGTREPDFKVNPEILKYQSMKNETKKLHHHKPYHRRK